MSSPLIELHGHAAVNGQVVVVGKATQEKDHGTPCWLCATLPPHPQKHEVVTYRLDAIAWLMREAGAAQVFECAAAE